MWYFSKRKPVADHPESQEVITWRISFEMKSVCFASAFPCEIIGLSALGLILTLSTGCSAQPQKIVKPHHASEGFRNLNRYEDHGFLDFLKWRWQRLWRKAPEPMEFPLAENDPAFLRSNTRKTTLTWIGHATVLLQLYGKNILTDPVFSRRASPVQWAGPKRVVPPGLAMEDLPPIDVVVISHDHYDALDKQTILRLYRRENGTHTVFFVPLGLKAWFQDLGIRNVIELDWWENQQHMEIRITAVPVQHWSKRSFFSRNKTLWAGWVIGNKAFQFFFCGDSGYGPHFKEIGNRLGPFDLSAIPIGAYEPRWFMRGHHMNPEEALQAHLDLGSRKSVAIHWGTFSLTDEPLDEPPQKLSAELEKKGNPSPDFKILKHGETIQLGY